VAHLYPQAPGTHISRLLQYAWVTLGLFLFPGHHTGKYTLLPGPELCLDPKLETKKLNKITIPCIKNPSCVLSEVMLCE
jgi:hypothetical protein